MGHHFMMNCMKLMVENHFRSCRLPSGSVGSQWVQISRIPDCHAMCQNSFIQYYVVIVYVCMICHIINVVEFGKISD